MKTTSYEISKKLKEAGFEAEADYNFIERNNQKAFLINIKELSGIEIMNEIGVFIKAYDLETLLDALPKKLANKYGKKHALKLSYDTKLNWIYYADKEDYILFFNDYAYCEIKSQENESLADTAGRMWLMLKEKGLIC